MKNILKITLFFITLTILSFSSLENTNNSCSIMHKGEFTYGNDANKVKIIINGKSHTEYHNDGKYIIKSEIIWVNDCEYNMTMKKVTIPDFPYKIGDVMNVKIKEVKENQIFITAMVNNQSWDSTITKIK